LKDTHSFTQADSETVPGVPAELNAADAYCRYLANRHYENFSVASSVLTSATRLHLARIYAFCRTTDDLGDESGPAALARLALWREQVERCFEKGPSPIHPVLLALSQTIGAFDLPPQPFLDLIDANVQDQTVTSYDTWDDLRQYCMLSAAPVGRMVLRVFGVREARAERLSDDVCIGLQLANFAQDVSIDRGKGRTYLLQSDLQAQGHSEGPRGAIRAMCDRAAGLLAAGRELEELVPLRLRIQLALYRLGGGAILAAVRQMDYRTDQRRPQLSRLEKARLVPLAVRQCRRRRAYVPAPHVA
jgi:squalene synthase HpnC